MNSFTEILRHWCGHDREPAALATVVRTTGSTYRKAGARLLVQAGGRTTGMVSGGCLERDIADRAQAVLRSRAPQLVSYDTRRMFGCNGGLEVFIERIPAGSEDHLLAAVETGMRRRQTVMGATVFEAAGLPCEVLGSHALADRGDTSAAACPLPEGMYIDGRGAAAADKALERHYTFSGGTMAALLQTIAPPLRVLIFGAHPDVPPLAGLCLSLGWQPVVIAHPSQDPPDLPPHCSVMRLVPEEAVNVLAPDEHTAAVVMTHHYGRDLACLASLLPRPLPYVGLMGPAARRNQLLAELAEQGLAIDHPALEGRLHGPAGLDIGGDGPAEVALSIAAEIRAVMSGRDGTPLKHASHSIHVPNFETV